MSRRALFPVLAFAVLSPGCIPVTEPVGDIDKAEPDKSLVGTWKRSGTDDDRTLRVEVAPEVKGNPKGLMWIPDPDEKEHLWLFVTTIGKQKYGNLCFDSEKKNKLDFRKEGEYEQWVKGKNRVFWVFKYTVGKDQIVTNGGDEKAFRAIANDAKIREIPKVGFETTPGWLASYLDKHGSDKLFPAAQDEKWVRVQK